jgi:hypothetical protein
MVQKLAKTNTGRLYRPTRYILKGALTFSAHVGRFQYMLTYLVRTNLYSKIGTNVLTTRLVRTPWKISIHT